MDTYKEKKQARIDYYKGKAQKFEEQSIQKSNESRQLADLIPMGQPILVGHHSEKRHRKYLERIRTKATQSIELHNKSDYYKQKAETTEKNSAISSDDPEAIQKLKEKLKSLEASHEFMKKVNSEYRKTKDLFKTSLSEKEASEMMELWTRYPYMKNKGPFATYSLSNNNANIRNVKERIERLEKLSNQKTKTIENGNIKVVDNVEANRLQIFFPGKPSEEIITFLKRNGFRWSNYNGCWQAYRNFRSNEIANKILKGEI